MGRAEIYRSLREYVARELLRGEEKGLDEKTPLLEWGVIDSLAMVGLLLFIEDRLDLRVPEEQVRPEHFRNLGALSDLLTRLEPIAREQPTRNELSRSIRALKSYGIRRERLAMSGGAEQHYLRATGRSPTWVLVPALGNPSSSWGAILRSIVTEQDAIALDLAGFGLSTGSTETPTLADHVAMTLELLDQITAAPVVLIGNSLGALVATEIARRRPDRVHALVIVSFGLIADAPAWWNTLMATSGDARSFLVKSYHQSPENLPKLAKLLEEALARPAYRSFVDDVVLGSLSSHFDGIDRPTLLVAGESDRILPTGAVEAAAERIPKSRVERIARCGHFPQVERPQELLLLLRVFLGSLQQTRAM